MGGIDVQVGITEWPEAEVGTAWGPGAIEPVWRWSSVHTRHARRGRFYDTAIIDRAVGGPDRREVMAAHGTLPLVSSHTGLDVQTTRRGDT